MSKRMRRQPNLTRAAKAINRLVGSKKVLKAKKNPSRKAKRQQQRLEKKKRRVAHQIRKAEKVDAEDTEQKDEEVLGPPTKKSKKKQSHDVVIRKGRDKNVAEISKLEKLLGMQPSKKKKKLPASFRTDGLDYILDITDKVSDGASSKASHAAKKTGKRLQHVDIDSASENDSEVESIMEFEEETGDGDGDDNSVHSSDGYISDSAGSDSSQHSDISEEKIAPTHSQPYRPPQLQPKGDNLKLKKSINGIINRLSTSNMSYAVGQMEKLFQSYSRNDVSTTFTDVILEACLLPSVLPDKFGLDYMMLVAIMHSRIGIEVGAHFLQTLVKKFDELHKSISTQLNKCCYNSVLLIGYLYNYLVVDTLLVYDIIKVLLESFTEGDVEILLMILKNCGMQIRRDNASSLKDIIQQIQLKSSGYSGSSRMHFMLDIITSLRTNNPQKIPGYDPDKIENMRKLLRAQIKGGLGDNQLKISLQDLLNAEHQGRWWIVGSSWSTKDTNSHEIKPVPTSGHHSQLMELARKQRMNTDVRKSVFCIIMSSEDYIDAFEKLLKLGLKDTQQRELVHVTLHCCLQEKSYNPYYAFLGQRLCEYNRSHQVTFQYAVWDKFKELQSLSSTCLENLWRFCSHLIANKAFSLSILRVVQFTQLDVTEIRFFTKLLHSLLTGHSEEQCKSIFSRLAGFEHLKTLRESLIFFMKHFLHGDPADDQQKKLNTRIKLAIMSLRSTHT
ncbi:nucleolar MIF4G domain-containing protein 1-like isoform X2 [Dysidea avara]|uniref:nucleolar MIF4G domain-containing protein 1-like isoform X2 n=1 Tax=Dysidea avara TaxID=196820 RepID=UPI00331D8BDD